MNNEKEKVDKEPYQIDRYDLHKMKFVDHKNSFQIYCASGAIWELIKLDSPTMIIPFGPETYNYKEIVNLEFTEKDKNNDMYNFFSLICSVDSFLERLSREKELQDKVNLPAKLKQSIAGKQYLSCIRPRPSKFDPLLRTHLQTKGKQIETLVSDGKNTLSIYNTKNKKVRVRIHVGSIWHSTHNFGINWILESVLLV